MLSQPVIVIPSRLASVRLERKPLALIDNQPMIVQVLRRALESKIGPVLVACCSLEIADIVHSEGGNAVLTDPHLPKGTDRVWAAIKNYNFNYKPKIIINLQGDLPNINPESLKAVLEPLENPQVDIGTIASVILDPTQTTDNNVVKIALAKEKETQGRALYFSRNPIPYGSDITYHHIGVYAYRYEALKKYVSLPISPLETAEQLEQLRALEAGMRIDVRLIDTLPHSVDTPEELEAVRKWFSLQK